MNPEESSKPSAEDSSTGLPGFRSWRRVYWFVLGVFVLWVGLLTLLTKLYS